MNYKNYRVRYFEFSPVTWVAMRLTRLLPMDFVHDSFGTWRGRWFLVVTYWGDRLCRAIAGVLLLPFALIWWVFCVLAWRLAPKHWKERHEKDHGSVER